VRRRGGNITLAQQTVGLEGEQLRSQVGSTRYTVSVARHQGQPQLIVVRAGRQLPVFTLSKCMGVVQPLALPDLNGAGV